jgi:hypothetical protein
MSNEFYENVSRMCRTLNEFASKDVFFSGAFPMERGHIGLPLEREK